MKLKRGTQDFHDSYNMGYHWVSISVGKKRGGGGSEEREEI